MIGSFQWRGWVIAAAIFILGAAAGAAGTFWIGKRIIQQRLLAPIDVPARADRATARIGADLTRVLELTPEQSGRIQAILDQTVVDMKGVRTRARQDALAELRKATARIAAELPPEKRPKFFRMMTQRLRRLGLPSAVPAPEAPASAPTPAPAPRPASAPTPPSTP